MRPAMASSTRSPTDRAGLVVALALLGVAPGARADESADRARKLFTEGQKAYAEGRFAPALDAYEEAYHLKPLPGFLYNLAQCHRHLGHFERAVELYKRYLDTPPGQKDAANVHTLLKEAEAEAAKGPSPDERARLLFVDAQKAYAAGRYADALTSYEGAYALKPLSGFYFNLAQCQRRLGAYAKAAELYRRYLAGLGDKKDALGAETLLREMEQKARPPEPVVLPTMAPAAPRAVAAAAPPAAAPRVIVATPAPAATGSAAPAPVSATTPVEPVSFWRGDGPLAVSVFFLVGAVTGAAITYGHDRPGAPNAP